MKFSNLFLIFSFLVFLSGCSGEAKKTIIIGVDELYPPFSFKKGNEAAGFDIDLLSAISDEIGYKAEFKIMSFDETLGNLKNGKIDVAAGGLSLTNERSREFLFSNPYYSPNFCMIFKKTKLGTDFIKLQDIKKDSKIGVQKNTVMFKFLENLLNQNQELEFLLVSYNDNLEMIEGLKNNEINFFIAEDLQAELLTQNSQDLGYFIVPSNETGEKESYAFAFNKKHKRLVKLFNMELKKFEENGKIDILKLRWFSSYGIYDDFIK
jgi:polar amino acid transport system substrate-binding protein